MQTAEQVQEDPLPNICKMAFSLFIVPALASACQTIPVQGSPSSFRKSGSLSSRAFKYRHPVRLHGYTDEKIASEGRLAFAT